MDALQIKRRQLLKESWEEFYSMYKKTQEQGVCTYYFPRNLLVFLFLLSLPIPIINMLSIRQTLLSHTTLGEAIASLSIGDWLAITGLSSLLFVIYILIIYLSQTIKITPKGLSEKRLGIPIRSIPWNEIVNVDFKSYIIFKGIELTSFIEVSSPNTKMRIDEYKLNMKELEEILITENPQKNYMNLVREEREVFTNDEVLDAFNLSYYGFLRAFCAIVVIFLWVYYSRK